ncbi:hypothetical protein C9J01_11800 [Photobacterium rosenbergii]|uniref:Uncharacterized protein n=1 Tax=Photobacterium rosenbergii TaxID=294936 RepID=A0A2T3NG15_9GAMM|nr:hypothetical protein C9J01_11800 [Photobacterium rosenbergii]
MVFLSYFVVSFLAVIVFFTLSLTSESRWRYMFFMLSFAFSLLILFLMMTYDSMNALAASTLSANYRQTALTTY